MKIKSQEFPYFISGYASVFNVKDAQNDVILPKSFRNLYPNKINLLLNHNFNNKIGTITSIKQDSYGLYIQANLDFLPAEPYEKFGFSIGFVPLHFYLDKNANTRYISDINLKEISLVKVPANKFAKILQITY